MSRRVVVTGLGVIAPNAGSASEFLTALRTGRSGISPIEGFDTSDLRVSIGGQIKQPLPLSDHEDRYLQLAKIAADEAWHDAGQPRLNGLFFGTLVGAALTPVGSSVKKFAEKFNCRGITRVFSNACAASTVAIGLAFDRVRSGKTDIMLAGGSEAFDFATFCGFHALRSLDPLTCRPFDRERQGLVVGEGAAFLVLEELERARSRGAKIYAELLGAGFSSDAYHETAPDPTGAGAARAIILALQDARLSPTDVSYINAHGTGTPQNDKMETLALKQVFGQHAYRLPVSSTKSMIGHAMGAAGAVEAVACVLAIANGFMPPTLNYSQPDPDCDLDYIPNQARELPVKVAMSNNFGFGGSNASLIFRKV